jgi:hypothetical protein
MPKSTYLDNTFLGIILRQQVFTPPVTVYVALYTVSPGVGGGGTEVTGGGYARQAVTFTVPVNGLCSNNVDVNFAVASADYGTVVAFALHDQPSGGNLLYFANLSTSRTVLTNDQVRFPTGQLLVSET